MNTNCVEEFLQLHQDASDEVWPNKMKKNTLVDQTCGVLIMGGFDCKKFHYMFGKESIPFKTEDGNNSGL